MVTQNLEAERGCTAAKGLICILNANCHKSLTPAWIALKDLIVNLPFSIQNTNPDQVDCCALDQHNPRPSSNWAASLEHQTFMGNSL